MLIQLFTDKVSTLALVERNGDLYIAAATRGTLGKGRQICLQGPAVPADECFVEDVSTSMLPLGSMVGLAAMNTAKCSAPPNGTAHNRVVVSKGLLQEAVAFAEGYKERDPAKLMNLPHGCVPFAATLYAGFAVA